MAPVVAAPAAKIYGLLGDPLAEVWRLYLFRSGRLHLFSAEPVTMANYPSGVVLRRPVEISQFLYDAPSWLVAKVFSPVIAYNLLVFLAIFTSAIAMYWAARRFGMPVSMSLWAGLVFTLAPVHMIEAQLHPALAQVAVLPIVLVLIVEGLEGESWRKAAVAGSVSGATAYLNPYQFLEALLILVAGVTCAFLWRKIPLKTGLALFGSLIAVCTPLLLAFVLFRGVLTEQAGRSLEEVFTHSPHPSEFFKRSGSVYVGPIFLGLLLLGLIRSSLSGFRRATLALAGVSAFFLSLPPRIEIGALSVPMPSSVLFGVVPFFRVMGRVSIVLVLVGIVLGASFLSSILKSQLGRVAAAVLALTMIVDFAKIPPPGTDVAARDEVAEWLAKRSGAVAEYPLVGFENSRLGIYLLRQMRHARPLLNGNIPSTLAGDISRISQEPNSYSAHALWFAGVRSLVLHDFPGEVPRGMTLVRRFPSGALGLKVDKPDAAAFVYFRNESGPLLGVPANLRDGSQVVTVSESSERVRLGVTLSTRSIADVKIGAYAMRVGPDPTDHLLCVPGDPMSSKLTVRISPRDVTVDARVVVLGNGC